MDQRGIGVLLVVLGAGAIVIGLLAWAGALSWFGRLPGDIRIERDNARIYIPIVSMLLASLVLSLVVWLARRIL